MHIRDPRNSNNFHGYKKDRSNHKLKVHLIPTNTPQKELHQIDLQETIVLRIKRERERGTHRSTKVQWQRTSLFNTSCLIVFVGSNEL